MRCLHTKKMDEGRSGLIYYSRSSAVTTGGNVNEDEGPGVAPYYWTRIS